MVMLKKGKVVATSEEKCPVCGNTEWFPYCFSEEKKRFLPEDEGNAEDSYFTVIDHAVWDEPVMDICTKCSTTITVWGSDD
jgi:hypothetical protein